MNRCFAAALVFCACAAAQNQKIPEHLFQLKGRLTPPSGQSPREIGRGFLQAQAGRYGVTAADLTAEFVAREYRTEENGVTHLTYRQQFQGVEVLNAEWTVNIDASGQVVNAGGSPARSPRTGVAAPEPASAMTAIRVAARAVNPELAQRFAPMESGTPFAKGIRFAGSSFPGDIDAVPVWWQIRGELNPAWKFAITDADGSTRWQVVVDVTGRKVFSKIKLTLNQSPVRGLVFDQGSPQPNPKPGVLLTAPPPVVDRTLQLFAGDAAASPKGWMTGNETAGNNVIAGTNTTGVSCTSPPNCPLDPVTAVATNGVFNYPVDVTANPALFGGAASVNLFYWTNRAHDWFYQYGFDEAAGNYQQSNYFKGGVEGDRMVAYALFGAAYPGRAKLNNAMFVPYDTEDGGRGYLAFFLETAGQNYFDNAMDAPTIVHEYTHAVSSRLVRQLNATEHGAAMGEGWSDFFALEFLTPEGAPIDGSYPFSEYPDQAFGLGIRSRPYSTRKEVNPLTFADLGHVYFQPEVHADGEIWFEALWEVRAAFIQKLGEAEGRRRIRRLVLDGMKLSPPAPSMIDMRDAILLADQVDYKGEDQQQIWSGFARRGMGVLAMAYSGSTIHVKPSFEASSDRGSIGFYEDRYVIGEQVQIVVQDSNVTGDAVHVLVKSNGGDVEPVTLRRSGPVFTGLLATDPAPVVRGDATLSLTAGDFITAFYNDTNAPGFAQVSVTAPVSLDYDYTYRPNSQLRFSGERSLGLQLDGVRAVPLPWAFPFFGNEYKQVWVHETGLLSFDLPSFSSCADTLGLYQTNGIAPLYMDLTTLGAAQSTEDVFQSQGTPDSVTFRWAVETVADFAGSRPEAVNFAATLWKDGRIQFQYGAGNRNLTGGSNFFGCAPTAPTVGISNGHENFIELIPTHDGKGTLENATTVVLDPPFNPSSAPVMKLESPAADDHVTEVLTGAGIVYDPNPESAIRRIDILVDGIAVETATLGVARTDFCNAQRVQGCPNVGFNFTVPLRQAGFQPGEHTLQLRTTNRRGYFVDTPATPMTFTLDAGEAKAAVAVIESPTAGQPLSGSVAVRGYAYSPQFRVVEVDVLVDGVTAGRATYTTSRTDICGGLSPAPPNCPRVGFTFTLNTRTLANGPHTISVHVIDETGRLPAEFLSPLDVTVSNPVPAAPVAVLTAPQANQEVSGTFHVSGYAYSTGGRIASATLVIDGYPFGTPTYGGARADACAGLTGVSACPNIGFDLDVDTTRLRNGPHIVSVLVRDAGSNLGSAPPGLTEGTLSGGLNIFVKN